VKYYNGSLCGSGHEVHEKCDFKCVYCGYDGRAFPNWFQLTVDHVVPRSDPRFTDAAENKVTACHACNSITSRMRFGPDESTSAILRKKQERVRDRQRAFFEFWVEKVAPLYLGEWESATTGEELTSAQQDLRVEP